MWILKPNRIKTPPNWINDATTTKLRIHARTNNSALLYEKKTMQTNARKLDVRGFCTGIPENCAHFLVQIKVTQFFVDLTLNIHHWPPYWASKHCNLHICPRLIPFSQNTFFFNQFKKEKILNLTSTESNAINYGNNVLVPLHLIEACFDSEWVPHTLRSTVSK